MKRFFYVTMHFSPNYVGTILLKQQDGKYINTETGEFYIKRRLYDFGWGQEEGFELLPLLSFEELITLIEYTITPFKKNIFGKYNKHGIQQYNIWFSNLYGAVAVIMQDYVEDFIEFLSAKIVTDYFNNPSLRKNYKCFSFDTEKTREEGMFPGGILSRSYEDILNDYPKWREISSKVINQVYREEK